MRITYFLAVSAILVLVACGGKPTAPETPNPDAYGKTIQPFHQIPSGDQEGGGKARSTTEKSNY
ncbi:hypothetical protein [Nitrosomonas sp.]|uniref:hypothetical protein n=1 Tax=Nitrosomonas sp. TaxID=42353 RepID=UPI0025EB75DD|nr:hypothetical protein [Nitrosomonas sp.]MBV6448621.1 hypothetical protein [Nitrosomonas sp.]